ncbi:unnamed protein product [Phaedon cochleariae]|uniref:Kinesin-like protein n=1 Tax=Phaedon cochleariae TaxID=80249 RepID=A0A9P0DWK2_PHACE|nr:unnamed protein product [Phaedon cochleariae]
MAAAIKKKQPLQNVKVVVRIRPLTKQEEDQNVKNILKSHTPRELLMKDKKYTFDRVFKPNASQIELYMNVVSPLIQDVVAGYNCTVFAYGQTGTGKTYTMTGEKCNLVGNWRKDDDSGVIPRAAFHIFHELGHMSNVEINVKVSYIELYNEEIRDLLSEDECALQMYSDTKGTVSIQGLKEVSVHDSEGILKLLQRGIVKRQIAPTLMNHQSSRSHTVFTISVNTRESTASGDDILKAGKINLVDLAGSENIARSGCMAMRATELANINRSLLTLGRVIQALADKSQKHVPYRDSKLTRILQDSLGGHTKTVIISTVSPAHTSHEETTSTLEYATRARDIKNTPIINEKMTKHEMIDGLVKEIDRLQKDLDAARSGTGFYVDKENYQRLLDAIMSVTGEQVTHEELSHKKAERIKNLEEHMQARVRQFEETVELCKQHQHDLELAKAAIKEKDETLEQERYLAKWYEDQSSEKYEEAQTLLKATQTLTTEKEILLAKLEHQFHINSSNQSVAQTAVSHVVDLLSDFGKEETARFEGIAKENAEQFRTYLIGLTDELRQSSGLMREIPSRVQQNSKNNFSAQKMIGQYSKNYLEVIDGKAALLNGVFDQYKKRVEYYRKSVPKLADEYRVKTENIFGAATSMLKSSNDTFKTALSETNRKTRDELDSVKKTINDRKLQDEESLRQLEFLVAATKRRLEENDVILEQVERLRENVSEAEESANRRMLETMSGLERLALESIKSFKDSAEMVPNMEEIQGIEVRDVLCTVQEFHQKLHQISINLDETHQNITKDRLADLQRHISVACSQIEAAIDSKVDRLLGDVEAMRGTTDRFVASFDTMVGRVRGAMVEQMLEKNVRAKHAGDTPVRQSTVLPVRIKDPAPREALLEKFRQAMVMPKMEEEWDTNGDSS